MCRVSDAAALLEREARERRDEMYRDHDGAPPKHTEQLVRQLEILASNARALARRAGTALAAE